MEVLKLLTVFTFLCLSSCSMVLPGDFAQAVAEQGITPDLVAQVELSSEVISGSSPLVAFVGGGGKLWVATTKGFYGYRSSDLKRTDAVMFNPQPTWPSELFYSNTRWSFAGSSNTKALVAFSGVKIYQINLFSDGTGQPTSSSAPYELPVGGHSGVDWAATLTGANTVQMNDGTTFGPVLSLANATNLLRLQVGPGEVFAVEDNPGAVKVGDRSYRFGVSWLDHSLWPTATSFTRSTYTVQLPPTFQTDGTGGDFRVLRAGGHTFAMPVFGVTTGNNSTTTIVVLDSATGKQLAVSAPQFAVDVAVDGGDAWYTLQEVALESGTKTYLRKYQW